MEINSIYFTKWCIILCFPNKRCHQRQKVCHLQWPNFFSQAADQTQNKAGRDQGHVDPGTVLSVDPQALSSAWTQTLSSVHVDPDTVLSPHGVVSCRSNTISQPIKIRLTLSLPVPNYRPNQTAFLGPLWAQCTQKSFPWHTRGTMHAEKLLHFLIR